MRRRSFLESAAAAAASLATGAVKAGARSDAGWRRFEVTTRLEIAEASGVTRAWVPLPMMADTEYQRRLGDTWNANTERLRVWRDDKYDAPVLCAEWPAGEATPTLEVTSRFRTRDRENDLERPPASAPVESPASLANSLAPTKLIPTDGIVKRTSREITRGRRTEIAKARAIYDWIVDNSFRDPKVLGCGTGDVRGMLESGRLGGKCADINALFVGLARAAGVPAREVFGLRVAESRQFKSLGRAGDVTTAQHCRAEFYAPGHGWVAVDPADVRKVVLEEPPPGRTLEDPLVQHARRRLFGGWEMNYLAYNRAHDLALPGASRVLPFLMYPQSETAGGRRDPLDAAAFQYRISARELA